MAAEGPTVPLSLANQIQQCIDDNKFDELSECLQDAFTHPDNTQHIAVQCHKIVGFACRHGNWELLDLLMRLGLDISVCSGSWMTPAQTVCELGHMEVLEFLYKRGIPISVDNILPWHEESPFYLACRNGHRHIIDFLIDKYPNMVKQPDVRSCLLYAACLGGNIDVVRKFLTPDLDINHSVQLVRTFQNSESLTPLYAACAGGHQHLIDFLLDNFGPELEFREAVCKQFPDMIGLYVAEFFKRDHTENEEDLFHLVNGNLRKKNLFYLHVDWLLPYTVTLIDLDISENSLTQLPASLPWKFQNLKTLNVSKNNIRRLHPPEAEDEDLCLSLEEVNLSHNALEEVCHELFRLTTLKIINLAYNKLKHLTKSIHQQGELQRDSETIKLRCKGSTRSRTGTTTKLALPCKPSPALSETVKWCCSGLKRLDVSNNNLECLPLDLKECTGLSYLYVQNNCLTAFPQAWKCPMKTLDVSSNQLERFPTNIDVFWSASLQVLNISNNKLDSLDEGIVKLGVLTDLNASNNTIERLPSATIWKCGHLHCLNLKHNQLGIRITSPNRNRLFAVLKRTSRTNSESENAPEFPESLSVCLKELRLADNNLDCFPPSIFKLGSLEILDLSDNPLIRILPRELGLLKNLSLLKMKNVRPTVPDNLSSLFTEEGTDTRKLVAALLDKLRGSRPCHIVKAVLLGKKDKGKTTLMNKLAHKDGVVREHVRSVVREEITLSYKRPEIKLHVWDVPGDEVFTLVHHSLFTRHSLYILVWDFWSIAEEADKIRTWINNIKVSSEHFKIVLVGTFTDRFPPSELDKALESVQATLSLKLEHTGVVPVLCPVSCIKNEGLSVLKEQLYKVCASMVQPGRSKEPLVGRMIPGCYYKASEELRTEQLIRARSRKPLCISQSEFMRILTNMNAADLDLASQQEIKALTKFLVITGHLLHFPDHLGALDSLYFLDPGWLCDVLLHLLTSSDGKKLLRHGQGKIRRIDVEEIYTKAKDKFPIEFLNQYLELLERFELAAAISHSKKLFVPSELPKDPPLVESKDEVVSSNVIRRLYCMAECPSGFWTRLLTRMMTRVEQFSKSEWMFTPVMSGSVRIASTHRHGSLNKPKREMSHLRLLETSLINSSTRSKGLYIKNHTNTFCQEWMRVTHADGSFCVEPVCLSGDEDESLKGILITEVNRRQEFGIMGVIVDEIEDIVQDFYPGLLEIDSQSMTERLTRYAVCPNCYPTQPLPACLNHFTVEYCAKKLVQGLPVVCPKQTTGKQYELTTLVPELLLKDLPRKFFMELGLLKLEETKENCLGGGVAGAVYKGYYGDTAVAVKIYRSDIRQKPGSSNHKFDSKGSDSGTATISTFDSTAAEEDIYENTFFNEGPFSSSDYDSELAIKSYRSLKELRQEVSLTSRLHHPCIISLVGVAFSPKLMMALELAPLGSLRNVLDKEMDDKAYYLNWEKDRLYSPFLTKELIFKLVYQIGKGLEYLHSNCIVYKDLKSDNILTMSLALEAPVNVKLSDYGISRYSWGGRSVGLVGTLGYQAPEILEGVSYNEQVDIFSFAMVIYEIFSGRRPFSEYENLSQVTKALKMEGKRPCLMDFNMNTRFPYLESLMQECWKEEADSRPPAHVIVTEHNMKSAQFVIQSSTFTISKEPFEPQCVMGASVTNKRPYLWVWEGEDKRRTLSVLDPEWGTVTVDRNVYPGPRVTSMTKVGKLIWIATVNNEIEVFEMGAQLELQDKVKLSALPLHILSTKEKHFPTVYVALENGEMLQFKSNERQPGKGNNMSMKRVQGYANPKTLRLRSCPIHCMTLSEDNNVVWVSNEKNIDIISVADFKVLTDQRVSMQILLSLLRLPNQFVTQIECTEKQAFTLLFDTPIVLEFDVETVTCIRAFTFEPDIIYKKFVADELVLSVKDHEAYKGNICPRSREDSATSLDSSDDDDLSQGAIAEVRNRFSMIDLKTETPPERPPKPNMPSRKLTSEKQNGDVDRPPVPHKTPEVQEALNRLGKSMSLYVPPTKTSTHQPPSVRPELKPCTSHSLPILTKPRSFSVTVTSISVVEGSLWVGRSKGDICVVDTHLAKDRTNSTYGQVQADMYDMKNRSRFLRQPEHVNLIRLGKFVASAYLLKDALGGSEVDIAAWDAYSASDCERVATYWEVIASSEEKMAKDLGNSTSSVGSRTSDIIYRRLE
ncbi:leucine-rich repeat serine/threonine-protein kinase 1-like isoform X2 [Dreissena polymorpha]|uniref:leucine-rich repeat serine/threonine-protein kinase 1-like isoform X2 n=1 Tax=Dreissena polymorpha TaxID=45954 RepID=UPI0022647117|nr:leucine-rich repeat serine/threonine-protein kinase 1-like isoform X2 [Dreissena polymorpha]